MKNEDVKTGRYTDIHGNKSCLVVRDLDTVSVRYDDGSYTAFFVDDFIQRGFVLECPGS